MKTILFALIILFPNLSPANLHMGQIQWRSCNSQMKRCYSVKADDFSDSLFSNKLFARNLLLEVYRNGHLKNSFRAPYGFWSDKEKKWVLLQAKDNFSSSEPHDLYYIETSQTLDLFK